VSMANHNISHEKTDSKHDSFLGCRWHQKKLWHFHVKCTKVEKTHCSCHKNPFYENVVRLSYKIWFQLYKRRDQLLTYRDGKCDRRNSDAVKYSNED